MPLELYGKGTLPGGLIGPIEEMTSCILSQEWNRRYELEFTMPIHGTEGIAHQLEEFQFVKAEGQWFRIHQVEKLGGGNYHTSRDNTVTVLARHVFYDLNWTMIDDEVLDNTGEIEVPDEVEEIPLLSCQEMIDHLQERIPSSIPLPFSFSVANISGDPRPMPDISRRNVAEVLFLLAEMWNAQIIRDNFTVTLQGETFPPPVAATVQYRTNMRSIQEIKNPDELVTRIYPVGANNLRLPERYRETHVPGVPGFPLSRHVTFNHARTEATLRQYADDFLGRYGQRDSHYRIQALFLTEEAQEQNLITPEDLFHVHVGDRVVIQHVDFGVDVDRRVLSVQRNLLQTFDQRIELGKHLYGLPEYIDTIKDEVKEEVKELQDYRSATAWLDTVMDYVHSVFGGTIRDIHPELLSFTPPRHAGTHAARKELHAVLSALNSIHPGYSGTTYTSPVFVRLPDIENARRFYTNISRAQASLVRAYIGQTVGWLGDIGSPQTSLVDRINAIYASRYGPGQIVSYGDPTMATVFQDLWETDSEEWRLARGILQLIRSRVGNLSEICLELGGGENGIIPTINDLYERLSKPEITVSSDPPDNAIGKDGDLWFQFTSSENE